jgi:hypothetical protein
MDLNKYTLEELQELLDNYTTVKDYVKSKTKIEDLDYNIGACFINTTGISLCLYKIIGYTEDNSRYRVKIHHTCVLNSYSMESELTGFQIKQVSKEISPEDYDKCLKFHNDMEFNLNSYHSDWNLKLKQLIQEIS